jgi:hypothetical protein
LNLTQIDLSDSQMIKTLLENLEILDELSGHYAKINDLRIDLLRKVEWANLDNRVLRLLIERLVNNKAYRQISSEMKVSSRWARKAIDTACQKIACSNPPAAKGPWFPVSLGSQRNTTTIP